MKLPVISNTILWVALAVFGTLYIESCFHKIPPNEKMIRDEERIKSLEATRLVDSATYAKIAQVQTDSIKALKDQLAIIPPQVEKLKIIHDKIPVIINAVDNSELLRRANGFDPNGE
jgi:hypothetical protein